MSMTDTRPDTEITAPVSVDGSPIDTPAGLAGWLTSTDHKVVGRLWLVTSLVFLVGGGALGALLGAERLDGGMDILDLGVFQQVYSLHGEVAVFLFLVPFFVGLATYLVPLQVGATEISFPRGASFAYWAYLVSGGLLLASYAADGGLAGGSKTGIDLYLLSITFLNVALCVALVAILTTIVVMRTPGMTLLRTPIFTWSFLVGGGLTLLATPVLIARFIELYVAHHFGGSLTATTGTDWFWAVPQVYVLAIPALGIALEIIPVIAGSRLSPHGAGLIFIGMAGVLGFGAFAQVGPVFDDVLYVGMGLAGALPILGLLGLVGDAMRRGRFSVKAPILLALGSLLLFLMGSVAGAASVIEALDLRGTVWTIGQMHLILEGAALSAALAALWFWAPKIWGVTLSDVAGKLVFLLTFGGALLLAVPDLVSGLVEDQAIGSIDIESGSSVAAMNGLSAAGGALILLAVVVTLLTLLNGLARRGSNPSVDDPWEGFTLEWATASPPPPANFDEPIDLVTSATPVLDRRSDGSEVSV
ncbi:MAG: cbb3-type cytochrome c oxidase subunit I [Acidimicrobiales bacterium]